MDPDGLGRRLPVRAMNRVPARGRAGATRAGAARTRSRSVPTAVLALLLALVVALLAAELTMRPSPADRLLLVLVFAGVTAVAVLTALVTRRITARSLRRAVVGAVVSAIGVAAFAVLSVAASMFLSGHDLRLVLVALGFGVVSGLVLAWSLTGTLLADLHAVGIAARKAAGGSRDTRTGVDRPDEVGDVARALDDLIERLDAADVEVLAAPQPQVRITDAGPGFPAGFGERAFEPFTRADTARTRNGTGAGLGLAIARGFVQAHGGTIGIAEGPGGRVVVRLPPPRNA